jgi:hypothetical protein
MTHKERYHWMLALTPGMLVRDPRGCAQIIRKIENIWNITLPGVYISTAFMGCLMVVCDNIPQLKQSQEKYQDIEKRVHDVAMVVGFKKLHDRETTLNDGTTWSALYCLLPVL